MHIIRQMPPFFSFLKTRFLLVSVELWVGVEGSCSLHRSAAQRAPQHRTEVENAPSQLDTAPHQLLAMRADQRLGWPGGRAGGRSEPTGLH